MQFEDIVDKNLSYLEGSERVRQWQEMSVLGEFVHDYHDIVIGCRFWETFDEVKGNHLSGMLRYWKRLQKA